MTQQSSSTESAGQHGHEGQGGQGGQGGHRARGGRGGRGPKGAPRERRIGDYLMVVRDHWLVATLVGGVVLLGFVGWTLQAAPVYETTATIQVEEKGAEQTVLDELSTMERASSVETEMEVMRSHVVARGATEDAEVQLTAICWEKHAYRSLATVERYLGTRGSPARMRVRTAAVPKGSQHLELRFDASGKALTVVDVGNADSPEVQVPDFAPGRPFEAYGQRLTAEPPAGSLAGKTFTLMLRAPDEAARFIEATRAVAVVGDHTGIVSIAFTAEAPEIAQDVVNALARSYLRLRRKQRDDDLRKTVVFLEGQIKSIREEVKVAEDARDDYMAKTKAFELRARVGTLARDQADLKLQQVEVQRLRDDAVRDMEHWQSAKSFEERMSLLVTARTDPLTNSLASEYTNQERQLEILQSQFQGDHPQLKAAVVRLAAARRQLEERLGLIAADTIETFKRDIQRLDDKLVQTKKTLEGYEKDLATYPEVERMLADKERGVETKRKGLERLLERLVEVQISQASDKIPAALIDTAQMPRGRKAPNFGYMTVLGLLFGFLAGIASAFGRDAFDHKVRTPDELEEELGISNYAAIPAFDSVRKKERRTIKSSLVALDAPRSVITEAYRTLRANIRFARQDTEVKALAITSALAGEGKTVTTLNLAIVLAEAGSSVVVIDADMRRSMVHEYMGCDRAPGLAEVLTGELDWKKAVRHSKVERLDLLTVGKRHERPSTLLDSRAFQALLTDLRAAYDYVLVDMPPVLAVSDAAPFFAKLDGVLLLCRAGRGPAGVYEGAMEQVERLGGRLLGTILNGLDARRGGRGSRYGYRGYYGYHAYYAYDEGRRKGKGSPQPDVDPESKPAPRPPAAVS